jgi:hypothetical protein
MSYLRKITGRRDAGMIAGAVLLCICLSAATRNTSNYETVLGPTPINHVTKALLTGEGAATATLNGNKLSVNGSFFGLKTPATDAHIMMGGAIGMIGEPVLNLNVPAATSGTFTGAFTLSAAQLAALRSGRLYIQVNSQQAPAPGGNLWGWLLPEHEKAGQDEPQLGHWFLPQGDGLRTPPGRRQS